MTYGQAKILTDLQVAAAFGYAVVRRQPERNWVMIFLSTRAGLRACEISGLRWSMVLDGDGKVQDHIEVTKEIAKKQHGRIIPMHPQVMESIEALLSVSVGTFEDPVIMSERGRAMNPNVVVQWFRRVYADLGYENCRSHSGRRTFATRSARNLSRAGASLRDLQDMMGHHKLSSTQVYLETSSDAKRKLVGLL